MIQKLRRKFVLVTMAIVTGMLFVLSCLFDWKWVLPTAISFGTTCYHFSMRLLVGWIVPFTAKSFDQNCWWFRPHHWEPAFYAVLKVKNWKRNLPTYAPEQFDLKTNNETTLEKYKELLTSAIISINAFNVSSDDESGENGIEVVINGEKISKTFASVKTTPMGMTVMNNIESVFEELSSFFSFSPPPSSPLSSLAFSLAFSFAFYYFFKLGEWCKENVNKGGGLAIIGTEKLKQFMFPVPPIDEQARLVAILDRFDSLCNDISEGLPAEIEGRRKQYEYYRDKLLTFKEKEKQR